MSGSILDTRGLMCPEPIKEAAKLMPSLKEGTELLVLATDPVSPIDFEVWCKHQKFQYLGYEDCGDWLEIRIKKKAPKISGSQGFPG